MRFFQILLAALVAGSPRSHCAPAAPSAPTATAAASPSKNGNPPPTASDRSNIFSIVSGGGSEPLPGKTTCSFEFQPSGSTWVAGLDESKVFHAVLQTEGLRVGIGKGGQIYSLRAAFGEGVAPQRLKSPWVDDVWHLVVTSESIVTPIHNFQNADPGKNWNVGMPLQYFIHQAGVYLDGLTGTKELGAPKEPFYSPILESHWDAKSRTLFIANWAQMARSPNVWKSNTLVLTAYRDLGEGAIEVTQALTNFGSEDLTFLNAPWGGVRFSSLPQTVLSKHDGTWSKVEGRWGWSGIPTAPFSETSGWIAWTSSETKDGDPSLALVFGKENEAAQPWRRAHSLIRYGTAGDNTTRDYNVVEAICRVRIKPGETLAMRWHLVAGTFEQIRKRATGLASHSRVWMPEAQTELLLPVWMKNGQPSKTGDGEPAFHLHAVPAPGLAPLFLMEDTRTGESFVTPDPYSLSRTAPARNPLPADHPEWALYENRVAHYQYESPGVLRGLLGYARKENKSGQLEFFSVNGAKVPLKAPAPPPTPTEPAR